VTIDLTDRVALVTGAARGIGRATAISLAEAGAKVVVSDVATPVTGLLYETGEATGLADVRSYDELQHAVSTAVERFGGLQLLVANAGIASWPKTTWQATEAEWQTMLDITLTGTWNTCRAAIPAILEGKRGGSIVIVSSSAALKPLPTIGHYSAAKAGLVGLMKSLALELAKDSIRVNTVHPGGTATPMTENEAAEHWQATAPGVGDTLELPLPIFRMEAVDIAHAIRWLCSDEARYVTGTTSLVDGGALLR
jgi:NAD(P)-dependent dehydrogenase (short-subunit alcohol dehydrogenase family)